MQSSKSKLSVAVPTLSQGIYGKDVPKGEVFKLVEICIIPVKSRESET